MGVSGQEPPVLQQNGAAVQGPPVHGVGGKAPPGGNGGSASADVFPTVSRVGG